MADNFNRKEWEYQQLCLIAPLFLASMIGVGIGLVMGWVIWG